MRLIKVLFPFSIKAKVKSGDSPLILDSFKVLEETLKTILTDLKATYDEECQRENLTNDRDVYVCFEHDSLQSGIPLKPYNLMTLDNDMPNLLKEFQAKLENLLSQSAQSLKLDQHFRLKIRILGEEHMKVIRQKRVVASTYKHLTSRGSEDLPTVHKQTFMFSVPDGIENDRVRSTCFKGICGYIAGIIGVYNEIGVGMNPYYLRNTNAVDVVNNRRALRKINSISLPARRKAGIAAFNEYERIRKERKDIDRQPKTIENVTKNLSEYYHVNIHVHSVLDKDTLVEKWPIIFDSSMPLVVLNAQISSDGKTTHMAAINNLKQYKRKYQFHCHFCKKRPKAKQYM